LLARVDAPAGGTCDGKACWRSTGRAAPTGFKYVDPDLTPNGGQKVVLKAGVAGKAKAIVKGKGVSLALPSLPLALPALAQLEGGGHCYEAYFTTTGVARNTATEFEGRANVPNTTTSTSTSTTSTTGPTPICGNGAREFPEQCDDGNLISGDCCSAACLAEPAGIPCAEDGNVCTQDMCSGLGTCTHPAGNTGLTCRPSTNQCDAAEQCNGVATACPADGPLPDGTGCDTSACATGETCTAGVCAGGAPVVCPTCEACDETAGCIPTPAPVCRQTLLPEKSSLLIKERVPDASDKMVWKWAKGEATTEADFGTPTLDDAYAVCLYDESALATTLAMSLRAPAAGVCAGVNCWRTTSSGYKYVDPELTPDGVRRLLLKAGANGLAGITFKAQGVNVSMPALPLGSVLRLQLQGNGECWQATFSPGGITQNDPTGFKARSD
jgi:cysteine-rich repeat protein